MKNQQIGFFTFFAWSYIKIKPRTWTKWFWGGKSGFEFIGLKRQHRPKMRLFKFCEKLTLWFFTKNEVTRAWRLKIDTIDFLGKKCSKMCPKQGFSGIIKTQCIVCTPSPFCYGGEGGGEVEPPTRFSKGVALTGPHLLEGGCSERAGNLFQGGLQFSHKK